LPQHFSVHGLVQIAADPLLNQLFKAISVSVSGDNDN
jgi:hypothetical protein